MWFTSYYHHYYYYYFFFFFFFFLDDNQLSTLGYFQQVPQRIGSVSQDQHCKVKTDPDDEEEIRWWVREVEDTRPWQRRHIMEYHMRLQHLLHWFRYHVKVEILRHFSSFFDVIQCHRGKDRFNLHLKSAVRQCLVVVQEHQTLAQPMSIPVLSISHSVACWSVQKTLHTTFTHASSQWLVCHCI